MSKCPEELKMFLEMVGIDPESVEIHTVDLDKVKEGMGEVIGCAYTPSEFFERIIRGAKSAGQTAKNVAKDMSDEAMKAHLAKNGFSEERINEIMKETEENRKREAEAAEVAKKNKEAVENNVVFMTLKSIAAAHGYKLLNACVKNGTPEVEIKVDGVNMRVGTPDIVFSAARGFGVSTNGVYSGDEMDMVINAMQKAVSCCKSLNSIDWRTWPTVE